MRLIKTLAAAAIVSLSASFAFALETQGNHILSDGTTAIGLQTQQGIHEVVVCGKSFYVPTQETLDIFKRMKAQLKKGGYLYLHTTDPSKRYSPCAWGRYEHLDGEFF